MRKLITLVAATALATSLFWTPLPAAADNKDDENSLLWEVTTDTGDTGADVTGNLWLNGKLGAENDQGNGGTYNAVGGVTPEQFSARMKAFYDQQAAFCAGMFSDVEDQRLLTDEDAIRLRNRYSVQCLAPGTTGIVAPNDPPPNPAVLGAEAVAQLTLPDASPLVGPDPSVNKWNMVAVGFPIWLWVEGVTQMTSSVTLRGHTITLVATRASVVFNMGDGTTVNCTSTAHYTRSVTSGTPSPNCGHVYQQKPEGGTYRVAAMARWNVTWSVLGESGTIPVSKGAARQLPVGELQALVVR